MKKVIRRGMFETNSSSMHSVIIAKDFPSERYPYEIGYLFNSSNYNTNIAGDFNRKLNLLANAYLKDFFSRKCSTKEFSKALKEFTFKMKTIAKDRGVDLTIWDDDLPKKCRGFFEQPIPLNYTLQELLDTILSDDDLIARFLFNDKSFVVIGRDDDWFNFYMLPVIAKGIDYSYERFTKGESDSYVWGEVEGIVEPQEPKKVDFSDFNIWEEAWGKYFESSEYKEYKNKLYHNIVER